MSEYCVELNNLTKKFGNFTAVDDFSLKLQPGKVYGFIGPNGAGKTTTMSMIMGTLIPTSGTGNVMGNPLGSKKAQQLLGYSPEFTSFYSDMSCMEYLWYMGTLGGLSSQAAFRRAGELIEKFGLTEAASRKVAKFSTGMKKKVSLAQAMIHGPKILLLDEPTANLDPTSRFEILETVRMMVEDEHLTVLISSHVLTELETVIDHVIMIEKGKLIMDEDIEDAQQQFKQGNLIVDTSDNELLLSVMGELFKHEETEEGIRFKSSQMDNLKKVIIKVVYENNLQLNLLKEEVLSLDMLYQEVLKEEKDA